MIGSLLLSCALKATVVFGSAATATYFLRRCSAAFRHQFWLMAMACAAALPVLPFLLPRWHAFSVPGGLLWNPAPTGHVVSALPRIPSLVVHAVSSRTEGGHIGDWLVTIWAVVVLMCCLRLAVGLAGLITLSLASRPLLNERFLLALQRCSENIGLERPVRLRIRPESHAMPCTFGLLRPVIYLPADCADWPDHRVHLVLTHELAHIQRMDWATGLAAEFCLALYWFHPLAWQAFRKLKEESERACDDAVLLAGEEPARYASELLKLVRNARGARIFPAAALAVARPTHLERRFSAMLDQTTNRRRPTRKATLLLTTALAVFLLPLAALRAPAQGVSGRLAGTVTDPRGAAVPTATVVVTNTNAHTRDMTSTDASGAFRFEALPAGEYEVRVLKPGFSEHLGTAVLSQSRGSVQDVKLEMGAISEQIRVSNSAGGGAEPHTGGSAPTRLSIAGPVQAAALIKKVTPLYPASAKASRTQGAVVLEATIGTDGVPSSLQVVNGQIDADLARSAVEAVSQWRYRPTLLNGEPIAVQTNITVSFTLID